MASLKLAPMVVVFALLALVLPSPVLAVHTNAVAHRGASADFPQNTTKAFQEAEKQGAEWIEFDARVTSDNVV